MASQKDMVKDECQAFINWRPFNLQPKHTSYKVPNFNPTSIPEPTLFLVDSHVSQSLVYVAANNDNYSEVQVFDLILIGNPERF